MGCIYIYVYIYIYIYICIHIYIYIYIYTHRFADSIAIGAEQGRMGLIISERRRVSGVGKDSQKSAPQSFYTYYSVDCREFLSFLKEDESVELV